MGKPTVGLTGGIASGKSTVAEFFRRLGAAVVDADQVARDVVAPGSEGFIAVVDEFGAAMVGEDGSLDRAKLGALVFQDPGARKKLNAITHPRIAAESRRRIAEELASDAPYVVYEAALLVENGLAKAFQPLIVVAVSPEEQLARLMARDGSTAEEAQKRIDSQLPLEKKLELADHVIRNDGALPETEQQVSEVHEAILSSLEPSA
ncbi:MAG: dephospho-CoA kinase [Deltaproteobacteria bacterium]|nr:dephospho-CoA kinase [Deltaproteobacteria bacterium]